MRRLNPPELGSPLGAYSHAIEVPAGARLLHVSGQVGVDASGHCPAGIDEQSEIVWSNLLMLLRAAHMGVENIVKLSSFVVGHENFAAYAAVRARHLGATRPASTSLIVGALVRQEWLVEVELVAAAEA